MSGHSKWASIKHKKKATDAKRGQEFTKLSRALIVAVRDGGPDPASNLALQNAIEKARAVVERAAADVVLIGERAAQVLSRAFPSIEALSAATTEQLQETHEVGSVLAEAVRSFLDEPRNRELIDKLKRAGIRMDEPVEKAAHSTLAGRTFVITGTHGLSRKDITSLIERHGGRVTGSVSRSTDFLVAGESPGSKLDRANELGVKVIDEHELLAMVQSSD